MSLPRFFLENQVLSAAEAEVFPLRLDEGDARHAKVLRLAPGEHIAVIDADRDYFECEIVDFSDMLPLVRIAAHREAEADGPRVMLLQGLAKGDKMETVIRHATEVGVDCFVPLVCSRSVVRLDAKKAAAKTQRWRSIAKSAAMQAGRAAIPEVSEPLDVAEAAALLGEATAVLVCWEEAPGTAALGAAVQTALMDTLTPADDARIAVVVGPEGGLTEEEVQCFLRCNGHASTVTLGPHILRTETAGIVAPALVLYELGGMGNRSAKSGLAVADDDTEPPVYAPPLAAEAFAHMFEGYPETDD